MKTKVVMSSLGNIKFILDRFLTEFRKISFRSNLLRSLEVAVIGYKFEEE